MPTLKSQLFITKEEPRPDVKKTGKKFFFYSEFGEILDLAMALRDQGNEVKMLITSENYKKVGDGIIEKDAEWYRYIGQDYIFVFDGCANGDLQDWLRSIGEYVIGGTKDGDELENNRQINQKLFKEAGFYQPFSKNFKDIEQAIQFVEEHKDTKWILKQNGDAPKSLNHKGHFDGSEDMIYHLREMQKEWSEQEHGQFDCDLMEVVEGLEVAASAFWNGHDYLRNKQGKVVGYLNFEEKKQEEADLGETTGEMGTTFIGVTEDDKLFKEIMLKPVIIKKLKQMDFRGVFDINCIKTEKGIVALEPTMRFGIPATSYEFIEGLKTTPAKVLDAMARGLDTPIEIHEGPGLVICVVAKPYPLDADIENEKTSIGDKLWIIENGKLKRDFSWEQRKHIHLYNFEKTKDKETADIAYKVCTKNGYLFTVTARGDSIESTRNYLNDYIKDNTYLGGYWWRQDIGVRLKEYGYA